MNSIYNRDYYEELYLEILLNYKCGEIKYSVIKPQYLSNKKYSEIFKLAKEYANNHDPFILNEFLYSVPEHLVNDVCEVVAGARLNGIYDQIYCEERIITEYKGDLIKKITKQFIDKEIDYSTYMKNMKKLDDIQIQKKSNALTLEEINENISSGKKIRFDNYPELNRTLNLCESELMVIGATTGAGKTGFMLNLMCDLMTKYQCIYFNIEMSKSSMYRRLLSINSGIPIWDLDRNLSEFDKKQLDLAKQKLVNSKLIIEHQKSKIDEIRNLIKANKDKDRHTIVFIDHLGLLRCDGKSSLYEQMTEIMKELRKISLDYNCTIIGASQLNRTAYDNDKLSIHMLKDSGELENSARKILLLFPDKEGGAVNSNNSLMHIAYGKNDGGNVGKDIKFSYDKSKQIFKELETQ